MQANCYFRLGDMAMDSSSILECSIYENIGYIPWGRILFIDKMGLIDANYDFKAYTEIEVTLGSYEGDNKSEIVFKADVVATDIRTSDIALEGYVVELTYIVRGPRGGLLASIPPSAYPGRTSVAVISEFCKKMNVTVNKIGNINPQDSMHWLLVNNNFLRAINYICERSYIPDSALLYSIQLNGSVSLYSIADRFSDKPKCTMMVSPYNYKNAALNNGKYMVDGVDSPVIYFRDASFSNQSGINKEYSSVAVSTVKTNTSKNAIESGTTELSSPVISRVGGTNSMSLLRSDSPQVYEQYAIAPSYRTSVIGSYSSSFNMICDCETFTHPGDVVEVVNAKLGGKGEVFKLKNSSGKYMVLRKGYHFLKGLGSTISSFNTSIHLISNSDNLGK